MVVLVDLYEEVEYLNFEKVAEYLPSNFKSARLTPPQVFTL